MSATTTTIKAVGKAQHHFWGEYSATILLKFESEKEVDAALPKLEMNFLGTYRNACGNLCQTQQFQKLPTAKNVICIHAADPTLKNLIEKLEGFGAEKNAVLSMATSIDYGKTFSITIPV